MVPFDVVATAPCIASAVIDMELLLMLLLLLALLLLLLLLLDLKLFRLLARAQMRRLRSSRSSDFSGDTLISDWRLDEDEAADSVELLTFALGEV